MSSAGESWSLPPLVHNPERPERREGWADRLEAAVTAWPVAVRARFGDPVTLWGAGGKSYGGLVARFAVRNRADVTITVPDGTTTADLKETPLPWADLTAQFEKAPGRSGGAVFVHPQHPDYPPTWLTRHYGPLCVGWPGVKARTFEPDKPFRLAYRLLLHRGVYEVESLRARYDTYTASTKAVWRSPPAAKKAD